MFNRQIRIDWVRKTKSEQPSIEDTAFYDKLTVASVEAENVVKKVALFVLAYVVLDTGRKVLIERAKISKF